MTEKLIEYKQGDLIFRQGYPADDAYIVHEGEVEIFNEESDGLEKQLAILKSGEMFGEMGILDDAPRNASARAHTDCVLQIMDL